MSETALPTISIVMPSLNQAGFIDSAIRSVLEQRYPAVEFGIVDGGSTDGTLEIISRYSGELAFVVSEPDDGQYAALGKGFARTTGEVMAWINADDMYTPWALSVVGDLFALFPEIEWLTSLCPLVWDAEGRAVACFRESGFSSRGFLKGEQVARPDAPSRRWIQQESTFWRRSLWERAGARFDQALKLAGDFELWIRFFEVADLYGVETPLGGFRAHGEQRSLENVSAYRDEALRVLERHGGHPRRALHDLLHTGFLDRAPRRLHRLATRLGLAARRPVCRHLGPALGWRIEWD